MTSTKTPARYLSLASAARAWGAARGIVGRSGGYLNAESAHAYGMLPCTLRAPGGTRAPENERKARRTFAIWDGRTVNGHCVQGWDSLGRILLRIGEIETDMSGSRTRYVPAPAPVAEVAPEPVVEAAPVEVVDLDGLTPGAPHPDLADPQVVLAAAAAALNAAVASAVPAPAEGAEIETVTGGMLADGDVFSIDGGHLWHVCAVNMSRMGTVSVYLDDDRSLAAECVRLEVAADDSVLRVAAPAAPGGEAMTAPTPQQAKILNAAAGRSDGLISGAGTIVRRNLIERGWVATEQRSAPLLNRSRGTTTEYRYTAYVITDTGRAAVGAPVAAVVDLDAGERR